MSEELSYPESSPSETDNESSDDQITIKEFCKQCFKPSYQVRRVRNGGAILTLILSCLSMNVLHYGLQIVPKITSVLVTNIIFAVVGLTIPLVGSLADVRFGRYKIIRCCLWIMWISSVILTATLVVAHITNIPHEHIAIIFLVVPLGIGWAGFQANIIQFGIDQLTDASTEECKSFVAWYVWTILTSGVVQYYFFQCLECKLFAPLMVCCTLTIALILNIIFKNILIKEPTTQNPFKLVYKVISYAIRHKYPRQRSAFTYCEDDIPSRIDFGKSKYGGPFTTEQVEDIKTLFQVILVIVIGTALFDIANASDINMIFWNYRPPGDCTSTSKFFKIHIYTVVGALLIPLHELLIYPLSHWLPTKVRSLHKIAIGAMLSWSRVIVIIALITYSRHNYIQSYRNATISCLFHEPAVPGDNSIVDRRWEILTEFIKAIANIMMFTGGLEHFCAQTPYSMKGLIISISFTFLGIFFAGIHQVQQIFENKSLSWGTGVISCGFWFSFTELLLLSVGIMIFFTIMKFYKYRKREDVLPNEQIFAERYYSKP